MSTHFQGTTFQVTVILTILCGLTLSPNHSIRLTAWSLKPSLALEIMLGGRSRGRSNKAVGSHICSSLGVAKAQREMGTHCPEGLGLPPSAKTPTLKGAEETGIPSSRLGHWQLIILDSLRMKESFPGSPGTPGPCEILKGMGVGETTMTDYFPPGLGEVAWS